MPKRAGDIAAEQAAEVRAQFGEENLEAVHDSYRRFADEVDVKRMLAWSIKEPLDDLLMPLFLAAVVTIARDLRLGELAAGSEPPRVEWANRLELPDGHSELHEVGPVREGGGERMARQRMQYAWYTALLKRTVTYGPWVEVPVEEGGNDA